MNCWFQATGCCSIPPRPARLAKRPTIWRWWIPGDALSSADARLPNKLVAEAIAEGRLPQFTCYPDVRPESTFGESRLDFLLEGPEGSCYVETKSVTLVEEGVGLFPDAPTLRGVKHLHSLMAAMDEGHRAGVIFVIQRADAEAFTPHDEADPLLGKR